MPRFSLSVVLTVYNMSECLEECLDSLRAQTFRNFELICIDDGSADDSLEILNRYVDSFENCTIVCQENKGAAAARNAGIDLAQGDYLLMLDSDDVFEPTLLEAMIAAAQRTEADVIVCRSNEFNHMTGVWHNPKWIIRNKLLPQKNVFSGAELGGDVFRAFAGWPWDKMVRMDFIRKNGLRFPVLHNSEDLVFVYDALYKAERITVIDQILIHHRTNRSGSVSTTQTIYPDDFYKAIVALKRRIQDQKNYAEVERGFLNWAVDFALWNIECFPPGKEREDAIAGLFNGSYPELELDSHPLEYFSLYPRTAKRYELLKSESEGGRMATRRSFGNLASTLWDYASTLNIPATLTYPRSRY